MIIVKNNRKKIIIIAVSIILLFLITIAGISIYKDNKEQKELEQKKEIVKQYTSVSQFNDIQEVALYLDCKYIGIEDSKQENIKYNVKMQLSMLPEEESSENFYEKLVQYSAYVLKYENFYIVDEQRQINVLVLCDKEHESVMNYYINNQENYFKKNETHSEISNAQKIENIKFEVQSNVLKNIINNDWKATSEIGTVESSFNKYDIYFDEGFQIKKVNNKVFNIIFTEKYVENIVNNITTKSTKEEIEAELGKPQFEYGKLIGYKADNMYVFFCNGQVSVYKTEKYDTEKIASLFEQYKTEPNFEKLTDQIKDVWKDYDIYEYSSNRMILQYTTKGIAFKYGFDNNNGIFLYNNYVGKISESETLENIINDKSNLPNNMYYENEDLVLLTEEKRINTQYDASENNNYASSVILNTSNKFKIGKNRNGEVFEIKIIAINNAYPNSELKEDISKGIWLNDDTLIYAIKNRGIFSYNAVERQYKTIVSGTEEYKITSIKDGKLFYDDTFIEINN